jgi:hypothetical protein
MINCFDVAPRDGRSTSDADGEGETDFNEKSKFLVLFARHGHP